MLNRFKSSLASRNNRSVNVIRLTKSVGRVLEHKIVGLTVDESRLVCRGGTAAAAYKLLPQTMTIVRTGRGVGIQRWTVIIPAGYDLLLRDLKIDFEGRNTPNDPWVRANSCTISYSADYKVLNDENQFTQGLLFWVATLLTLAAIFYIANEAHKQQQLNRDKNKIFTGLSVVTFWAVITTILAFLLLVQYKATGKQNQ